MRSAASNNEGKVKDCASSIFLQLGTISFMLFFDFAKARKDNSDNEKFYKTSRSAYLSTSYHINSLSEHPCEMSPISIMI